MAGLGDSYMLPKPGQETEHLWVLITNPDPATHEAIMVNVTTQRPHSDTTTILNVGSILSCRSHRLFFSRTPAWWTRACSTPQSRRGAYNAHAAFQASVILRIQAGLLASTFTPKKIKIAYAIYAAAART